MSDIFPDQNPILPPQSREAEEAVIGACLINPSAMDDVAFLNEEDFYFGTTCTVWRAMRALKERNEAVDILTVTAALSNSGELSEIGGPAQLMKYTENVYSFNTSSYGKIIQEKAERRALLTRASELAKIAYDESQPVRESVSRVVDSIYSGNHTGRKGSRHISEGLKDLAEMVDERMAHPNKIWGIPTGFKDIDVFTGGLQDGELTYLAGEPAVGKTKLAMQWGVNAALPENGSHGVVVYSFEQRELEIIKRIVSGRRHITTFAMNSGKIDDKTFQEYCNDVAYVERLPIFLCDEPMTPAELRADLHYRIIHDGVELFILDYLLLLRGYDDMDETPRSTILSRMMKDVAQTEGVPGVSVSSVLKDQIASTAAPTNKGIRGSAQVIHDADNIAFLTPCQTPATANIVQLTYTKTRNINRPLANAVVELLVDSQYPVFSTPETKDLKLADLI